MYISVLTCKKLNTTAKGTKTAINIGVVYMMMIKVLISGPSKRKRFKTYCCMLLSMMSTSLENLFRIRPKGVVSKNDIGQRTIRFNMSAWSSLEADTEPITIATDRRLTASTG